MNDIDGKTQVYAVLGDPVDHSLSPRIHNAAFQALGMNAVYLALRVKAHALKHALEGLHAAGVRGLNLTTPHKEEAFRLARAGGGGWVGMTREAESARAINTLRWESEGWQGHATDGLGFLKWIDEESLNLGGKRVLVLGAGGAARAVVMSLREVAPASVHIVSRDGAHAASLVNDAREVSLRAESSALSDAAEGGGWQVIVRALSVEKISDEEEAWWRASDKGAIVLDLNYGDRSDFARGVAGKLGLTYRDGCALLIHQGAASFEFWTGKRDASEAMREVLSGAKSVGKLHRDLKKIEDLS